jgi:hypothetical protein
MIRMYISRPRVLDTRLCQSSEMKRGWLTFCSRKCLGCLGVPLAVDGALLFWCNGNSFLAIT